MGIGFFLGTVAGFGFAFYLGHAAMSALLKTLSGETRSKKVHRFLTKNNINYLSLLAGGMAFILYGILFLRSPREFFFPFEILLLILGSTFYIIKRVNKETRETLKTANKPFTELPNEESLPKANLAEKLDELTRRPNWDWQCFRSVLICLAEKGVGNYIPASRRPDYISLQGLQNTFYELQGISQQSEGRETSRVVFVDKKRSCLVISGFTRIGSSTQVKLDYRTENGREHVQIPVMTIHVHPNLNRKEGLSDVDYISFISDSRLIIMMITFEDGTLFAMKTTATPRAISTVSAQQMISTIMSDITKIWVNLPDIILAFNKAVCLEFGMTLYQTKPPDKIYAHRIEVVNL